MISSFSKQVANNLNPCRSIKTRLGWVLGVTVFAISIFAGLIIAQTRSLQLEADVGHSFADLAYQMTDKLDRGIFERYLDIQLLSTLEPLHNPNILISQKRELLQKLQSSYPAYAWIGLTDQQGKVIASTGKLLEGENLNSRPWFKQAKTAHYVGDVHEVMLLAKLLPNPTGAARQFVDISAPITDSQGNYQGVLCAYLSWTWAQEVQESLLHSLSNRRSVEVFILNQKAEVLLSMPKVSLNQDIVKQPSVQAALKRQNNYLVENWSDRKSYITGFSYSQGYGEYRGLGWLVLVRQPRNVAFAPIQTLQHNLILGAVIAGILLASIGWFITSWIVSPILAIAAAADQIRRGNTSIKLPIFKGNDEIARLSKTLKQLIGTLSQQEKTLKEREEQLRLGLQAAQIGTWNFNLQTGILSWSELHERLFGMAPGSFDGTYQTFINCIHPEDRELLEQTVNICRTEQTAYIHEFRVIWSDGSIHWIAGNGQFFYDETGVAARMAGAVMEISDRKIAEINLAQQEQKYRTLVQNFPNGAVLLFDHDLRYTLVDGKGLAEVGLSKELMEGKIMYEFLPPESAEILEPIYREALSGGASTFEMPYADHTYLIDTLPIKNEQGEILCGMVMSQDITERKRAELSLLQLKDQLEIKVQERTAELTDANQQLQQEIIVRRFAEQQLHESQICLKLINSISTEISFGTSPVEAIKRTIKKLSKHFKHLRIAYSTINRRGILTVIHTIEPTGMPLLKGLIIDLTTAPEYLNTLRQQQPIIVPNLALDSKSLPLATAWAEGATQAILEMPLHHPNGLVGLLSFHSPQPYQWNAYEIATLIEVADYLSITIREAQAQQERARAETATRESEERYRQLVEHSPETILVCSDQKIVYINAAGSQLFGATSPETLLNTPLLERVHLDYQTLVQERIESLMQDGKILPLAERQMIRCDGQIIDVETTLAPIIHQGKPAAQFVIRDISQRKQAEQELQESEMLIRSLHQVATHPRLSIKERFQQVLAMGCQHFNLEVGFLASVENEKVKMIAVQTPDNSLIVGDVFDLKETYCLNTLKQEEPLCIQDAKNSKWCYHPSYDKFGMETYIGTRVMVNNQIYGTLCFSSRFPAVRPFRSVDIGLLKVMSQWVGSELERSKAAANLEQLRHQNELILNSAGEGICGINSQGNITFVNPAAAKMLGYQVQELINQPICHRFSFKAEKIPFSLEESFLYPVLKNGIVQHFKEQKFWRKDGSNFPVECLVTPMRERQTTNLEQHQKTRAILDAFLPASSFLPTPISAIVGVVITFKDITERKAIERMKDEFISVVSHELRTPLTAIRGSLGLMASGLLTTQPQKAKRMLDIAAANTDRLTRLINDILDIERIESGKIQMEKAACDVDEAIANTTELLKIMTQNAEITLVVLPVNQKVWADRDRLIQILTNLISNAIKFSPPKTTITITAEPLIDTSHTEYLDTKQAKLLFKIKDQGRGIPSDKLESIFGRFQQINASDSRDKGGTGLGLAICRSIIQQHHGRIWAESQLAQGSTFCFTLPLLQENKTTQTTVISLPNALPTLPVVLLCDDDISLHNPVQIFLAQRGYRVVAVASGQEAIAQASLLQPSVLLLDLIMPEMDGWATMAALKEQASTKNIPIIIFSVLASEQDNLAHPDVVKWLPKPMNEQSLFEAIEQSLQQQTKVTRVLVVEDDLDLARVLITMFENYRIQVHHAATGQEAIHLSQQVRPHLLLLDLELPDGNGFTVVEWLRLHDHLREIPLLVYSAKELSKSERDRLILGPTEFFTKGRITPEDFEQQAIALLNRIVS
jgi:PAS domain S-box-containing protein